MSPDDTSYEPSVFGSFSSSAGSPKSSSSKPREPECESDEDCLTLYAYWATANVSDVPDGCFDGGAGWTSSGGGGSKDWSYTGQSLGVYYCTTREALDAANAVLPTLTGACAPSVSIAFYGVIFATSTCEDGECVYTVNDNRPESLAAALECGPP